MSQHRRSRVWLSLLAGVVAFSVFPALAVAGINDLPADSLGTSSTNPNDPSDEAVFWRDGWGNSIFPEFTLNLPAGTSAGEYPFVRGFIYAVDRTWNTEIDETQPSAYDAAWDPTGTTIDHTLDLPGIFAANPVGFATTNPNARLPIEGQWWFHWSFFDSSEYATRTITGDFKIDLTPPLPISKMTVRPYIGYAGAPGAWMPNERAVVAWEDKEYDLLAGTAAYEVWVNGDKLVDDTGDPLYVYHLDHTYTSLTLEHLAQGKNTITVKAVDRATNVGPGVSTDYFVDSDTPTVEITSPKAGALVPRSAMFSANASDGAGIRQVQFYVDGQLLYTDTSKPYALAKDMGAYATGKHTLTVKAKDMYGREVSASRDFTLDKTPPALSYVSDYPDPFYPVLVDNYYDYSTVRFYSSEKVYAYLYYYRGDGTLFTGRSAPRGPGWCYMSWNGRDLDGNVGIGTFSYRVVLRDTAGNETWGSLHSTTIRDYEIIRVADNAVKVVPR